MDLLQRVVGLLFCCAITGVASIAQNKIGVTHSGHITGQVPFPINAYNELSNPVAINTTAWSRVKGVNLSWGSKDIRYKKEDPACINSLCNSIDLVAWRGERVSAQWVVWGNRTLNDLSFDVSDLIHKNQKDKIDKSVMLTGFVRYVMADELNKDGRGGCGSRPNAAMYDSTLVADPIDHLTVKLTVEKNNTQGGWVRIWVPQDAKSGFYQGLVTVKDKHGEIGKLKLRLQVKERTLPEPKDWAFHLDLWQNPFAIARYHQVEPWSDEHFECMRPYMEMYRDAGGKAITASIMHKPWNGQTYDYFETMITWMKKADGTWSFDYTIFDRWVEFMIGLGIKKEITCYSMIPWRLSFQYYDQATNSLREIKAAPGEKAFEDLWLPMLKSFAAHLKEKGWFSIAHISMDERPMPAMKETIKVIRKADPDFKISLSGALHEELSDDLDDYCVALRMKHSDEMKAKRKAEGKVTTYYTSCEEPYPNTFTFCPPAECAWFGWYAAKEELDGYLRWAYNSWVIEPLLDSRFYTWAAGDTYLVYPEARTSLRFEHMIEGIQAYEKIRILKEECKRTYNNSKLREIQKALEAFDERKLPEIPASVIIERGNKILNQ